jgi:hypothetical protein
MKLAVALASGCLLALGATGCQRHEAPAETQEDVAKAQAEGQHEAAEARHDAVESTMDAQKDVNEAKAELGREAADGRHDIVVAEAEAAHKVAIERCEAMTGDPRTDCKKEADLAFEKSKMSAGSPAP